MSDFLLDRWWIFLGVAVAILVWWRLSQKPMILNLSELTAVDVWEPPLVSDVLPALAEELCCGFRAMPISVPR